MVVWSGVFPLTSMLLKCLFYPPRGWHHALVIELCVYVDFCKLWFTYMPSGGLNHFVSLYWITYSNTFVLLQRVFELDAIDHPHEYIYMDEAGEEEERSQHHRPQGHCCHPWPEGGNITLGAAISNQGVVHHHAIMGPYNTQHLLVFLNDMRDALALLEERPTYVVVWDNVSFQRSLQVRE